MDIFLARQPIFDTKNQIYGYEILYRDGKSLSFTEKDKNYATGNVLARCFLDFGIEDISDNHFAFINFTSDLIKSGIATIFPKEYLIIEILEDVLIDDEILSSCIRLKEMGYRLAIDDFEYQPAYEKLIPLVDLIKIDFNKTSEIECAAIIKKFKRKGLKFLAEKLETHEDYLKASRMGFDYFQGYFFARPEIKTKTKFIPYHQNRVKLINKLNQPEPDFNEIAEIIEDDFSFAYEILRLVNSAFFGFKSKISSVRHAIAILGINELKQWIYLVFLRDLKDDKPDEIINVCMFRGKFLENLAVRAKEYELSSEMLTLGMFSMVDVLMEKPIEEALSEMNFSDNIKLTLSGKDTISMPAKFYRLCLMYERGEWDAIISLSDQTRLSITDLNEAFLSSIHWLRELEAV